MVPVISYYENGNKTNFKLDSHLNGKTVSMAWKWKLITVWKEYTYDKKKKRDWKAKSILGSK
jgi:hypothetical protein